MKKEYLVTITRNDGSKENGYTRYRMCKGLKHRGLKYRVAPTLEEAVKAVEFCKAEFVSSDVGKVTTQQCGMVGVSTVLDKATYDMLKVVDYEIKVREVTDWEVISK